VSCAAFAPISYAQLPVAERALPRADQSDPGNLADTDETVAEIDRHNARYDAICSTPRTKEN